MEGVVNNIYIYVEEERNDTNVTMRLFYSLYISSDK